MKLNDVEWYYFEELARKQKQIYPDACDYGVLLDKGISASKAVARGMLLRLIKDLDGKVTKDHNMSTTVIERPIEYDGGRVNGEQMIVEYFKDPARKIEFLTINFCRFSKPRS